MTTGIVYAMRATSNGDVRVTSNGDTRIVGMLGYVIDLSFRARDTMLTYPSRVATLTYRMRDTNLNYEARDV